MLMDQVNEAIKEAMKAKEAERLQALRFFKSKLIENKTASKPQEEMDVLIAHVKKLKDSVDVWPAGHAERDKIMKEVSFLTPYMPIPMDENTVKVLVQEIVTANPGANKGLLMKELMPKLKGKFDGKEAGRLVDEVLAKK